MLSLKEQKIMACTKNLNIIKHKNRMRMYDKIEKYPFIHKQVCDRYMKKAQEFDITLPKCIPTHCLTNYYEEHMTLKWHRDIYENDGDEDFSIVNLSIGAPCIFGYEVNDRRQYIKLNSGDAVIFGGKSRFIPHCVHKVLIDESPSWLSSSYRISYTFRDSSSVLGEEERFKFFDVNTPQFDESQKKWK